MKNEVLEFCDKHGACTAGRKWAARHKKMAVVWEKCRRPDWMFWILRKHRPLDKKESVTIAIECAELALPEWTAKYPSDDRPRLAIEAAKKWLAEPTDENARAAARAAYIVYSESYSAVSAAARAARAAARAARAAARAASATSSASVCAEDSAANARQKRNRKICGIIRRVVGNPFNEEVAE